LARLAANRLTTEDLDDLAGTQQACLEAMARGETMYKDEIAFHRIVARASGNPVFMLIQDFVNSVLADSKRHLKPGPDFLEEVFAAHDRILEAFRTGDPELAATLMHQHVCEVESSLEELQGHREEALNRAAELGSSYDFTNRGVAKTHS
jgi:GntR family transcriptional repressor for pyruvate dehydrogenase complex